MSGLWTWLIVSLIALVAGSMVTFIAGALAVLHDGPDARPDERKILVAMVSFLVALIAALSTVLAVVFLVIAGIRMLTGT